MENVSQDPGKRPWVQKPVTSWGRVGVNSFLSSPWGCTAWLDAPKHWKASNILGSGIMPEYGGAVFRHHHLARGSPGPRRQALAKFDGTRFCGSHGRCC